MCANFQPKWSTPTFLAQICSKKISVLKFRIIISELESASSRYHMCHFSDKMDNFDFLAQICPKMDLGLQIQKTNVGIRISILELPCVLISRQNGQLWLFRPSWSFISKIPWVLIWTTLNFSAKFEEFAQLRAIF